MEALVTAIGRPWTGERIARLGYLIGLGWDYRRIASDPLIRLRPDSVFRQARRYGLSFRAAAAEATVPIPAAVAAYLDAGAAKRGITREMLLRLLLLEIALEPSLLDNILDDQN